MTILQSIGSKIKEKLDAKLDKSGGTLTGALNLSSSLKLASYASTSLPSAGTEGRVIYISNLDCLAVDDGSSWRKIDLGSNL